jgi:hypothetical protein
MALIPHSQPHEPPGKASFTLVLVLALARIWLKGEPWFQLVLIPVQYLDTALHEMGHALFCLATGGTVTGLTIVGDGDGHAGLTFTRGGIPFIYNQTGYLGTTLFGCLMLWLGRGRGRAACRAVLIGLGVLIATVTVLFMAPTVMQAGFAGQAFLSVLTGLALAGGLVLAGSKLSDRLAQYLLLFLGVQIALGAVDDVIWLAKLSLGMAYSHSFTDATNQAELTHLPAAFWSILWCGLSLAMLALTLRLAYWSRSSRS